MYAAHVVAMRVLAACTVACVLSLPATAAPNPEAKATQLSQHGLPVVFEPNLGQAPVAARFLARTSDGETLLTGNGVEIMQHRESNSQNFYLSFVGANPAASPSAISEDATGGVANYYTGQDKSKWIERVPLYSKVRYSKIYPGTDLVFHGSGGRLEYDFDLAPGASPDLLQLDTGDTATLSIEPNGSLKITNGDRSIELLAPKALQATEAGEVAVPVSYQLLGPHRIAFELGAYDRTKPLLIDPVVSYASFLNTTSGVNVTAIAADPSGDLILTGDTFGSNSYPVVNGLGGSPDGSEQVFVTKFDPSGETILYSTYLPASGFSSAYAITTDTAGSAYVVGQTGGYDFPVTSANLGVCNVNFCNAGFVTKLNSAGQIVYSTVLASGQILPRAVTVNAAGNAFVSGLAADNSLLTVNAFQAEFEAGECSSCWSAFFAELNTAGNGYVFSSYLGVGGNATGIALDASGNIYVAGSIDYPYASSVPLKQDFQSGVGGFFLNKFASGGKTLLFGSYLGGDSNGGAGPDALAGVAVGPDGTVYLGGTTGATDFPWTLNAYRHPVALTISTPMFAMAINPALTALKYSTYLGNGTMAAMGIDAAGNFYAAGQTSTPIVPKAAVVADVPTGGFFLELSPTGLPIQSSAFGGKNIVELPSAMVVDPAGDIYLAGAPGGSASPFFNCCGPDDSIAVGAGGYATQIGTPIANGVGANLPFFAKIAPQAKPQISLGNLSPFLPLRNVGSADLHISSIAFSGGLAKASGNCGSTVPAGTACILIVTDAKGKTAQGSVTITSDATPAVQTFTPNPSALEVGATVGDLLSINTNQLNFPPQQIGVATAPHSLYIWNLGLANLALTQIAANGDFSQTNNCTAAIKPGTYCTVEVIWKPTSVNGQEALSFNVDGQQLQAYSFPLVASPTPLLLSHSTNMNFGTQIVGQPGLARTITITNVSDSATSSPVISTSGGGFTFAKACGATLQPQQSCLFSALFTPVLSGDLDVTDSVEFTGGNSASFELLGTAQGPSSISAAPLQLQWPQTQLGSSSIQIVTLTNNSTANYSVATIAFGLPDFSETDNCHAVIAKGASCTVRVEFKPQQFGQRNDVMSIDAGLPSTQSISLSGTGQFPMVIGASGLDFGSNNLVGKVSAPIAVEMANVTKSPIPYNLTASSPFSIVNPCGNPLPAGTHCAISVSFRPSSTDEQSGTLHLVTPGVPGNSVPLVGTGYTLPEISAVKSLYVLGAEEGASSTTSLTISNTGSRNLEIGRFALTGANPTDFNIPPGQCSFIVGLGKCALQINFAPTAPGTLSALLSIYGDSTNSPQTVALTGYAFGPAISFSPTSIKFANQAKGTTSAPSTITVKNTGNEPLAIASISVSTGFSQTNTCGAGIYAGSTCQITITFAPTAAETYAGKLTLTDNASSGSQTVSLAGTGTAP